MKKFVESDESTDSDSTIIAHSRVEPLNWYIANREWSMGHVSREANQSTHAHKYENRDYDELSDSKSQECIERLRKKCHFRNNEKKRMKKRACCACCCRNASGTSLVDKSAIDRTKTKTTLKKSIEDKKWSEEEKLTKKKKKKRSKENFKSGKKETGATKDEPLPRMVTGEASADITKSCCYLCAENSMAIVAARVSKATRATQVVEDMRQPSVRTVQSSVRVKTCDRSTDSPNGLKKKKIKLKNFKPFSKYIKKMWPIEKNVPCSNNKPVEKKSKKSCGKKECRRYASSDL